MLDRLIAFISHARTKTSPPTADGLVLDWVHSYDDNDTLVVALPPWHYNKFVMGVLHKRLARQNMDVLSLNINNNILSSNVSLTIDNYAKTVDEISLLIEKLMNKHGYKTIQLIAISLSTTLAGQLAQRIPFAKITLIVPSASLAEGVWGGIRTRHLRREMEAQGITLQELNRKWSKLAPLEYRRTFEKIVTQIILAKRDRYVPYHLGKQLADSLQNTHRHKVSVLPFGHVATIVHTALFAKL